MSIGGARHARPMSMVNSQALARFSFVTYRGYCPLLGALCSTCNSIDLLLATEKSISLYQTLLVPINIQKPAYSNVRVTLPTEDDLDQWSELGLNR